MHAKTKSGNIIYMADGGTELERKRALTDFLNAYNKSFSVAEQKFIGNIAYLFDKYGKRGDEDQFAATNVITDKKALQKLSPKRNKMGLVEFTKDSYNSQFAIIHEIIHVRKIMQGMTFRKQATKENEQKQDFETIARISKSGLEKYIKPIQNAVNMDKSKKKRKPIEIHGYYFNDRTVPKIVKKISKGNSKKEMELGLNGVISDRNLLTGSIDKNIIGRSAEIRSNKLFPQSFFNLKSLNTNITSLPNHRRKTK
jgi:hypothetical protein